MSYSVVAVSAKTGKEIKRPRKGQKVMYAVKGPKGGLNVIRKEPQKFFKTDFAGLNKSVAGTTKKNFVVYEQKLRTLKRDAKGKPQYRVDKKGVKHKMYETKITFAKPKSRQKPLLYAGGKMLRALDLGYKKGNYQKAKYLRELTLIKPNTVVHEQVLKGRTLKEAISNIQIDVNMASVKKHGFGLYYNVFMVIHTPSGEDIKVPVQGSFRDNEFQGVNYINVKGERERFGRSELRILANLHSQMSKSMRYALKNAGDGYTFTSLAMLDQIKDRQMRQIEKAEKAGNTELADKLTSSLGGLYFGYGERTNYFVNDKTKLTLLRNGYSVTLYVKFEMMYD